MFLNLNYVNGFWVSNYQIRLTLYSDIVGVDSLKHYGKIYDLMMGNDKRVFV